CQKSANHCNLKRDAAKLAEEQSNHLYLSIMLQKMTETGGLVIREGIVVQVMDVAFDVMVPELGLEKRAFKVEEDGVVKGSESGQVDRRHSLLVGQGLSRSEGHLADFKPRAGGFDGMDHPDDATNAYDDERGLFDDESDYEDDDAIQRMRARASEQEDDEFAANMSEVKIFGRVQVAIQADTSVSPPVIKVVAMNPYAV
ncbi:hypothetical protein BGZ98_001546, partial [Dissophora globulifera]